MSETHIYSFEKLIVWQKSRELVTKIYKITEKFPLSEQFGLTSQLKRASISISANIAEGTSRTSNKDQAYFSQLAYSSLMEVLNHLYIAYDLGLISEDELYKFKNSVFELSKMINGLRKSQIK